MIYSNENIFVKIANDAFEIIWKTVAWAFVILVVIPLWIIASLISPHLKSSVYVEPIHEFVQDYSHPDRVKWRAANNKLHGAWKVAEIVKSMGAGRTGTEKWEELLDPFYWRRRTDYKIDMETAQFMAKTMNNWGHNVYLELVRKDHRTDIKVDDWDKVEMEWHSFRANNNSESKLTTFYDVIGGWKVLR